MNLVTIPIMRGELDVASELSNGYITARIQYIFDWLFFLFGLQYCIFSTALTIYSTYVQYESGQQC
jgi:hypothetical protein